MANSFKRAMALTLAAAMVATAVPATNFGTISADAASYKVTGTTAPYTKTTNKYVIKGLKKGMYAKVSVTGNAKSKVTVKQGSKKIKASTKIKGTGKNITLKVTNKAAAGKKYNVVVKYFNKKGKQVKKITKKATIYAQTTSVTITPVTGAAITGASINVTGASIQVGTSITLTAAKTPEKNTKKITWKTSDAKVASVANGVVTAVGAGKATITATSGKASASYEVTVDDSNVMPKIVSSGCKQAASDKITLSFNKAADKVLTKNDIVVERKDKSETIQIKELNFSQDGKTADVVLAKALTDKMVYVVSQTKDTDAYEFTAVVGEPASFQIKTTTAQKGEDTKIDFSILDATGMDVTAAISNLNTVVNATMKPESSYVDYNFDKASNLKIKMDTIDSKATVVLNYEKDSNKFSAEGVIVCVKNEGKTGTPMFMMIDQDDANKNSKCAKFYKETTTSSGITVYVGEQNTDLRVYFCAVNEKKDSAIFYDSYTVSSGNNDVLGVDLDEGYGKYAKIAVDGVKEGNTVINVEAVVNDAKTHYTIPVVVKKKGVLATLKVEPSRTKMSNAYDLSYDGSLSVKAYDNYGNELKAEDGFTYVVDWIEANKSKVGDANLDANAEKYLGDDATGFLYDEITDTYTAYGAKAGSYDLKVTGSMDDKQVVKTTTIRVDALGEKLYTDGQKLTYEVELLDDDDKPFGKTFDEKDNHAARAVLAAKVGSTFVGYVRQYDSVSGTGICVGTPIDVKTGTPVCATAVLTNATFTAETASSIYNGVDFHVNTEAAALSTPGVAVVSGITISLKGNETDVLSNAVVYITSGGVGSIGDVNDGTIDLSQDKIVISEGSIEAGKEVSVIVNLSTVNTAGAFAKIINSQHTGGTDIVISSAAANVNGLDNDGWAEIFNNGVSAKVTGASDRIAFSTYKSAAHVDFYYDGDWDEAWLEYYYDENNDYEWNEDVFNSYDTGFTAILEGVPDTTEIAVSENGWDGEYAQEGAVTANEATTLWGIAAGVKYGSYYSSGELFNFARFKGNTSTFDRATVNDNMVGIYVMSVNTYADKNDRYYVAASSGNNDKYYANLGNYTVRFDYLIGATAKKDGASTGITVKNTMYIPTVTYKETVVESLSDDDIIDVLRTSVDLNNNDGENKSIGGTLLKEFKDNEKTEAAEDNAQKNKYVKYVEVIEDDVHIYVPISINFSVAS